MSDMRRRDFSTLLGGAAAWPLAARAQQTGKVPTIGFLGAATSLAWGSWTAAFVKRLHELGWIEGRTVTIEYRWAEASSDRMAEIAAEFVRLKVDVILTLQGLQKLGWTDGRKTSVPRAVRPCPRGSPAPPAPRRARSGHCR